MSFDLERFSLIAHAELGEFYEFLDAYFLHEDDGPGDLGTEFHQLEMFYTMYTLLSDGSGPFEDALDALCEEDFEHGSCTDDCDRDERLGEIRRDVQRHLVEGLERCGKDRYEALETKNSGYIDEILSEHQSLIDGIGGGVAPDEIDIGTMIDEVRRPVLDLEASLASSSWFASWLKHPYTLNEFAECLCKLRAQQHSDLASLKTYMEQRVAELKVRFEQRLAASKSDSVR
ncbi:MAG: hypothetical protein OXJ37_02740 [Bryobacterales bacterium]|nr:hypothetical protein [Bryobacterales bacterium]MDE0261307.1 hypothetical protein [Bryobacterales bacterium]MDE0623886.1 hypothetical protein [Bryobacterales bacterium]